MTDVLIGNIFKNIVETIREPLLVLDSRLKIILASKSFYGVFRVKPEETVGLNHFYPLYGLPFAQLITEVVLSCMGIVMLRRIFRMEKPH